MSAGFQPHSESVAGSAFVIDEGRADDGAPVTRVRAQAPFFFKVHSRRWGIVGGKVLPLVAKLDIQPGCGGIGQDRRTGRAMRIAQTKAWNESRGWTIIPLDSIPDSHWIDRSQPKSYLYRPDGRKNVCLDIYTACFPGLPDTQTDMVKFVEFLEYQIAEGVIPPCPVYVLSRLLSEQREKEVNAVSKAAMAKTEESGAAYEAAAKVHRTSADIIEAEIASRRTKAKPVRRRKAVKIDE